MRFQLRSFSLHIISSATDRFPFAFFALLPAF